MPLLPPGTAFFQHVSNLYLLMRRFLSGVTPCAPQFVTPTIGTFANHHTLRAKSCLMYGLVVQPLANIGTPLPEGI
jgi:hypothetical protein